MLWKYDRRVVAVLVFFILGTIGKLPPLPPPIWPCQGETNQAFLIHVPSCRGLRPRPKPPPSPQQSIQSIQSSRQQRDPKRHAVTDPGPTHPRDKHSLHVVDRDPSVVRASHGSCVPSHTQKGVAVCHVQEETTHVDQRSERLQYSHQGREDFRPGDRIRLCVLLRLGTLLFKKKKNRNFTDCADWGVILRVHADSLPNLSVPRVSKTGLRCHGRRSSIRLGSSTSPSSLLIFFFFDIVTILQGLYPTVVVIFVVLRKSPTFAITRRPQFAAVDPRMPLSILCNTHPDQIHTDSDMTMSPSPRGAVDSKVKAIDS